MSRYAFNPPPAGSTGSSRCDAAGVPHHVAPVSRRGFLSSAGAGFGALALEHLLRPQSAAAGPLAGRPGHHRARAKSVIFLFMEGGPSHLDTFDRKPLLNKLAGKPLPDSFREPITAMGEKGSPLLESKRKWKQHGESGLWISDWLPETARFADDLAVVRSCYGEGINHSGGCNLINTGSTRDGRPSLGSWITYGLGTENEDLPAFVVMKDAPKAPVNGVRSWGSAFLPAVYQGTPLEVRPGKSPIADLHPPDSIDDGRQRKKLELIDAINRSHAQRLPNVSDLEARIASYELAFRMQSHAPEAVDLADETEETYRLYGMDQKETEGYGRICLLARRLVERGVRFIQLYSGTGSGWDSHSQMEKNHTRLCRSMDRPVAGLLADLKRRGLLEETLVVWGGEFGRTPMSEKGDGRDHNPDGFTMWFAGGGVRGGQAIGATDELGLYAVEDRLHVHDLHASILHLMGLDRLELSYNHQGRLERPTVNEGAFCEKLLG